MSALDKAIDRAWKELVRIRGYEDVPRPPDAKIVDMLLTEMTTWHRETMQIRLLEQAFVQALHDSGLTIIEAIKRVRTDLGFSLRGAKHLVACHPAYSAVAEANEPLHDDLERMMEEDE